MSRIFAIGADGQIASGFLVSILSVGQHLSMPSRYCRCQNYLVLFVVADNPIGETCFYPDSDKLSVPLPKHHITNSKLQIISNAKRRCLHELTIWHHAKTKRMVGSGAVLLCIIFFPFYFLFVV